MPYVDQTSKQNTQFKVAAVIAGQFRALGVPVGTITEILPTGQRVNTADPRYKDDGGTYQYVADIWSHEMSLPLASLTVAKLGGYNGFKALATTCFNGDQLAGMTAVLALPKITGMIDAALPFNSPIAPDLGDDPGVGSGNVINPPHLGQ